MELATPLEKTWLWIARPVLTPNFLNKFHVPNAFRVCKLGSLGKFISTNSKNSKFTRSKRHLAIEICQRIWSCKRLPRNSVILRKQTIIIFVESLGLSTFSIEFQLNNQVIPFIDFLLQLE